MLTSRLYAYGTLQVPAIITLVVGRALVGQAARLDGYARFRVADRPYPAIVEAPGASVVGVVYSLLDAAELHRLDTYEGPLYERRPVQVWAGAERLDAFTYVLGRGHTDRLSGEPWDLDAFERDHLEAYLAGVSLTARAP